MSTTTSTLVQRALEPVSVTQPQTRFMAVSCDHATRELIEGLRAQTRHLLQHWALSSDTIDAVELALCELYANVVTHVSGSRPCTVALDLRDGVLKLCVRDNDDRIPTVPADPNADLLANTGGESGRGLCLVAVYADSFHYERLAPRCGLGKTAIAEWNVA